MKIDQILFPFPFSIVSLCRVGYTVCSCCDVAGRIQWHYVFHSTKMGKALRSKREYEYECVCVCVVRNPNLINKPTKYWIEPNSMRQLYKCSFDFPSYKFAGMVCSRYTMLLLAGGLLWQFDYVRIVQSFRSQCLSWCNNCHKHRYDDIDVGRIHDIRNLRPLGTRVWNNWNWRGGQRWCWPSVHIISRCNWTI